MLNLEQTPKLLQPLVKDWSPQAFIVSFKLETDVNIISKKARESLRKNLHQVTVRLVSRGCHAAKLPNSRFVLFSSEYFLC